MTKEEFNEFYSKNKVAVIGVPFLIFFILFNQFVLKPRLSKTKGAEAVTTQTGQPAAVTPAGQTPNLSEPPAPLVNDLSSVPKLDTRVESRLLAAGAYPYGASKNIFLLKMAEDKPMVFEPTVEEPTLGEETPEVVERPDISYHGFFKVGAEKVAILKISARLHLTRVGQALLETPFILQAVFPDRIVIADGSEGNRQFEVALSQSQLPSTAPVAGGIPVPER